VSSAPAHDLTSRLLRRERLVVGAGLALLALLCWSYLLAGSANGDGMVAMRPPPFSMLVLMWWLMMVAMMLPSATPAILLYARVRQIRRRDPGIADTWVFLAGYLGVWLFFSVAAALAQRLVADSSMMVENRLAQGTVLLAAGLYQLSPLKNACLGECRSPAAFISRHWRSGLNGAVLLGVRHGLYCLGCCWTLMALLFVGGVMNFLWIVGLTLVVAVEKLAPRGALVGKVAGVALAAWGMAKLAGY
jgi:predicted metal-binding membrane protein